MSTIKKLEKDFISYDQELDQALMIVKAFKRNEIGSKTTKYKSLEEAQNAVTYYKNKIEAIAKKLQKSQQNG